MNTGLVTMLLTIGLSFAANAADLSVGLGSEPDSLDPHFHDYGGNLAVSLQIFEPLVRRDAKGQLTDGLATRWEAPDDHRWVFHLRPGVTFSNGEALTADDVIYTIRRVPKVPNSPAGFAAFVSPIAEIDAPDSLTVVMHTNGPSPLVPYFLASIGIVPHSIAPNSTTSDFNTGKAAIGTGPYRFVTWQHGDRLTLARNDVYWGPKPAWDKVSFRFIANPASRAAALLSGDVDIVDRVSVDDVARIQKDPKLRVSSAVSENEIFIEPDAADRAPPFVTGPDGQKLENNPLANPLVRRAIDLAINRAGLKRQIMNDQAEVATQIVIPGESGYDPSLVAPAYDPARAKALLAEAGYKDGLRITMHCQGDRYPNGPAICQAVAQMLTRIGIRTEPVAMPHAVFIGHANKHEYSLFTGFMIVEAGEASLPMTSTFATPDKARGWGTFNRSQYHNPKLDQLLEQAQGEVDSGKREALLQQAAGVLSADSAYFPLLHPLNVEAMRAGLTHVARPDGHIFAADVTPVK